MRFRIQFLIFSGSLLLSACASDYKLLQAIPTDSACVDRLKPMGLNTSWYQASVDVVNRHISGLLLIKEMEDNSTRVVFTNEAGITYFDFGFEASGKFTVHHVIRMLNKKPVIQTLRKDFELLLGIPFSVGPMQAWKKNNEIYYGVQQDKKRTYFITDSDCTSLQKLELGSKRKRMVTGVLLGENPKSPDSIILEHHTFKMRIELRKLERE